MNLTSTKPILRVLDGEAGLATSPVWIMRQAGRYLSPNTGSSRKQAGSFLASLLTQPRLAEEVTLQPIRRSDSTPRSCSRISWSSRMRSARIVRFVENEGPRLDPVTSLSDLGEARRDAAHRAGAVFETLERLKGALPPETTLAGLLRRPLDRRELHDRRKGHAGSGASAPPRLSRSGLHAELIDELGGPSIAYLTARSTPARRRSRSSRALGRRCRRPCSIALARTDPPDGRGGSRRPGRTPG